MTLSLALCFVAVVLVSGLVSGSKICPTFQDAHAVAVQLREEGAAMGTADVLQKNEGRSCLSRSKTWKRLKGRKVVNLALLNKEKMSEPFDDFQTVL